MIQKNRDRAGQAGALSVYDMVCIALFAVVMAICSWITIPTVVPFTMQTFGLFLTLNVLGGRRGTLALLVYLLLGLVGLPVFSGFQGGPGVLLGTTGGYLTGFILTALLLWATERLTADRIWLRVCVMLGGMALYFAFGTVWFMAVYTSQTGPVGLGAVLGWCVVPFLIPDLIKMGLALALSQRLRRVLPERR